MRRMMSKISSTRSGARPEARFVEHQQFRLGHQRAADRQHLLLAARQVAGLGAGALGKPRKPRKGPLDQPLHAAAVAMHRGRGEQIFLRRQLREDAPAFEHMRDAAAHASGGSRPSTERPANITSPRVTSPRSGLSNPLMDFERGALAGAVGSQEGDKAALRHVDRDAFDRQKHAVIDDLDIVQAQQHVTCHVILPDFLNSSEYFLISGPDQVLVGAEPVGLRHELCCRPSARCGPCRRPGGPHW